MTTLETSLPRQSGRALPGVIVACGCLIALLSFGPRSTMGFFLTPMSQENHWSRDVFSLALAVQNLVWGAALPFAGAFADRFGTSRVLAGGAILYVLGLVLLANAHSPAMLELSAGDWALAISTRPRT
jgi:MFS family permease